MVVALQVAGPAPRRWFRRRKASAQMEKIRVGDGMYYLITARPDKRGRLPWEEIRRLADYYIRSFEEMFETRELE